MSKFNKEGQKTRVGGLGLWIILIAFSSSSDAGNPVSGISSILNENQDGGEMVLIPEGDFIMGSSNEEVKKISKEYGKRVDFSGYEFEKEKPRRSIYVKGFYIDKYEVTNTQYKKFIDATGHKPPHHWKDGIYPPEKRNHPVTNVSFFDAKAYASWAGKRLPTEEEWEKAARGSNGGIFPWGDEFNPYDMVATAEGILNSPIPPFDFLHFAGPVDQFNADKSPYGVYDMAGNVMEWTDSWYEKGKTKIVKGGSWVNLCARARCAAKGGANPDTISPLLGFRCVKDGKKMSVDSREFKIIKVQVLAS
mgnify:CR=1 FL=1